MAAIQTK